MSSILVIHRESELDSKAVSDLLNRYDVARFPCCLIELSPSGKFGDDIVFSHDDCRGEFIVGAILNKQSLSAEFSSASMVELLQSLPRDAGRSLRLEGSFIGASVRQSGRDICVYTDCLGNYPLYYYSGGGWTIASNKIGTVVAHMRCLGIPVEMDPMGAYSLLVNAYMFGDHTLVKGVRRVPVGCRLEIGQGGVRLVRYWDIPEQQAPGLSDDDLIDRIDSLFTEAVSLQAAKNREYGYANYCAFSAGLDSRMVAFSLKRLGIDDVVLYSYSETGQYDQVTPQEMARFLGYEWVFRSLDSGADLARVDEGIGLSDFRVYYPWASQLNGMMKLIATPRLGLVHTGVIGDVVVGSFCHRPAQLNQPYKIGDGAYSTVLADRLRELAGSELEVQSYSYGMMRNRAFNGACLGYSTVFQEYTEALSPFMYRPLYELCMGLPDSMRLGHTIYYRWVREQYPEAARFPHNGQNIRRDGPVVSLLGREIPLLMIPDRVKAKLAPRINRRSGMNPMQYWYDSNSHVSLSMDSFFLDRIDLVDDKRLRDDLIEMYANHTAMDKTLVLSLLGFYELLFEK